MDISIIIVNYKSWKHLTNCLNSIKNIKFNDLIFEVIVIDNFSNDGNLTSFKEKFKDINFSVNSGNNGFANACNLGAKKASGKYFLFLNPDTIVCKEPIKKMYNYLKLNIDCAIVSCSQKNAKGSYEKNIRFFPDLKTLFGLFRAIHISKLKNYKNKEKTVIFPDWVSGSVVFISKCWFKKINGWNEDYWMYYEDIDLSKKASKLGGMVALLTDTEIFHNHGGSSRINIKTASITKTEVLISKHVYIRNHFNGFYHGILQSFVVVTNIVEKIILSFLGIIFFFIPKLHLNLYLFIYLIEYYFLSIKYHTWISIKSLNHPTSNK